MTAMGENGEYKYTGEEPLNREPKIADLLSSFYTLHEPYDRNHGVIPTIDPAQHLVHVDGLVQNPLRLTIPQLRDDFPQHHVTCALQCAGNRRHTMRTLLKEVSGIDWFDGAVMNCRWKGPRLRDILRRAGVAAQLRDGDAWRGHTAFACYETAVQDDTFYGGSIELGRALREDAEVILALEMNGEPLNANHGAPVRVIVPGVAGARSVKWLNRITVQEGESENFYQQRDYKILPPEAVDHESAREWWPRCEAMTDMPVNSIVGIPEAGSVVKLDEEGMVETRGYALPQGSEGPVVRVDVSGDEGVTWVQAELSFGDHSVMDEETQRKMRWAWCLWRARVRLQPGEGRRIVCKATDAGGNTQQEKVAWNLRGVGYSAWGEARELSVIEASP